jgi:hypothetical protein
VSTFVLAGDAAPIGYTAPHGLNIVAGQPAGSCTGLARYSLSGRLARPLGLKLVSNTGTLIRSLRVPGTAADSCNPVRWWNGGTVLASCGQPGDLDVWQLPGGLYLQSAGPCGVLQIFRQARGGAITLVTVPHTTGDNRVLTALGSRPLIQAPASCTGSVSLLWFDPATRAEQWLIRAPAKAAGAAIAIPFYSRQNGNL